MKTTITFLLFNVLLSMSVFAQKGSLNGTVKDNSNGEAVIGASIVLYNNQGGIVKGTVTDENGQFSMTSVNAGEYLLEVKSIGYADITQNIKVGEGAQTLDFNMVPSTSTLEAVTISGNRRSQRITESSANIQVISPEMINVAYEPTTYGLLKGVNGVDFYETGLGQQQVNARGFASPFTGGMLTLVDYRSVTLPGIGGVFGPVMGVNQNDIKQIEVIVGPNSALYGANAAQGVINIITKNPKEYSGHEISLRGGNRSQFGVSGRSSMMLGEKFGYKVAAEYFTAEDFDQTVELISGGQPTGIFTNPDNRIKNTTFSGSLYFFPTENTELSYTGGLAIANYVNQSNIGPLQVKDFTFWYHQLRASFNNFLGLGSAFIQGNYTADDAKNTYNLENVAKRVAAGQDEQEAIEAETFVDKPKRFNLEFQHNFDFAQKNIFTWGAQFTNTQPNSEGTFLSDGPNGEKIVINEFGAYLQYENEMVKNFNLTLSGRYDYNDVFGDRFSPKVSLSFKPKNHNFRIAYNEAFSSPPIQPAFALSPITTLQVEVEIQPGVKIPSIPNEMVLRGAHAGFTILDKDGNVVGEIASLVPTVNKSWEIGYKGLIAQKLFVDVTYFNTNITNFMSPPIPIDNPELVLDAGVIQIPTGKGWADLIFRGGAETPLTYVEGYDTELVLSYINYGKVNTSGVTASLEWMIISQLSVRGSYQFINLGEFKDVPESVTSLPILNSPGQTARAGIRYSNRKGIFIDLSFRWVDEYEFLGAREYQRGTVPSYNVFDLKGETPVFGKWMYFGIAANNIFNTKYRTMPGTPELGFMGSAFVRFEFGKK